MRSSQGSHDQAQEENGQDRGNQNEAAVQYRAENGAESLTVFLKHARDAEQETAR